MKKSEVLNASYARVSYPRAGRPFYGVGVGYELDIIPVVGSRAVVSRFDGVWIGVGNGDKAGVKTALETTVGRFACFRVYGCFLPRLKRRPDRRSKRRPDRRSDRRFYRRPVAFKSALNTF